MVAVFQRWIGGNKHMKYLDEQIYCLLILFFCFFQSKCMKLFSEYEKNSTPSEHTASKFQPAALKLI